MVYVTVTLHAHQQYCSRVAPIGYRALNELCAEQYHNNEYTYNRKQFIQLAGVWWVVDREQDKLTFITCYGRTHINIPKALTWAARQNDRLRLDYAEQT